MLVAVQTKYSARWEKVAKVTILQCLRAMQIILPELDSWGLPVCLRPFNCEDDVDSKFVWSGTFGRVLECWDRKNKEYVAIKIVRNVQKYRDAAMIEVCWPLSQTAYRKSWGLPDRESSL